MAAREVRGDAASQVADARASEHVERTYGRRRAMLVAELRLFAGANLLLFAACLALAVWRTHEPEHVALPASILAGTTLVAVIVYALAQDWWWSFLTGQYVGSWYLIVVAVTAALLTDIACNRARVSSVVSRALWYWPV